MHLSETLRAVVTGAALSFAACEVPVAERTCDEIRRNIQEVTGDSCQLAAAGTLRGIAPANHQVCTELKPLKIAKLNAALKEKDCK